MTTGGPGRRREGTDGSGLCGAGTAFTRNPATGEKALAGDFFAGAAHPRATQGFEAESVDELATRALSVHAELERAAARAEEALGDLGELDFVVERGALRVLEVRVASRSAAAALRWTLEAWTAGAVDLAGTLRRIPPRALIGAAAARPVRGPGIVQLGRGTGVSPGVVAGPLVVGLDTAGTVGRSGGSPVLVTENGATDGGRLPIGGLITVGGGHAGDMAVLARTLERPAVSRVPGLRVGVDHADFDGCSVVEGQEVTVDGWTGEIYLGVSPRERRAPDGELLAFLSACDGQRRIPVLAEGETFPWADDIFEPGSSALICRTPDEIDRALTVDEPVVISPGERDPLQLMEIAGELAGYGVDLMLRVGPEWPAALGRLPALPWLAVIAAPDAAWAARALAASSTASGSAAAAPGSRRAG
jgi:pyruvate,orthophosphate dikinase